MPIQINVTSVQVDPSSPKATITTIEIVGGLYPGIYQSVNNNGGPVLFASYALGEIAVGPPSFWYSGGGPYSFGTVNAPVENNQLYVITNLTQSTVLFGILDKNNKSTNSLCDGGTQTGMGGYIASDAFSLMPGATISFTSDSSILYPKLTDIKLKKSSMATSATSSVALASKPFPSFSIDKKRSMSVRYYLFGTLVVLAILALAMIIASHKN